MTNTQFFTRLNEALAALPGMPDQHPVMHQLLEDLKDAIRLDAAAKECGPNGLRVKATKIALKMLKAELDKRPSIAFPWTDGNGRQCFMDGYQAYRLVKPLPLPERPASVGDGIDLDRIFPTVTDGWKVAELPGADELKSFIALKRAENRSAGKKRDDGILWRFGEGTPYVNAEYLLNAVTIFPEAKTISWINGVSPLVIQCDDGDGLILPVRVTGQTDAEPKNEAERKAVEAYEAERKARDEEARKAAEQHADDRRKAERDVDIWTAKVQAAQLELSKAKEELNAAKTGEDKCRAIDKAVAAAEAEANARLKRYEARTAVFRGEEMELWEVERVMECLELKDEIREASGM